MKIKITDILRESEHSVLVAFHTNVGSGKAIWQGGIPQVGKDYHVEFDIPDTLTWGRDLIEANNAGFSISSSADNLLLQGQIEQVDEDGSITVRVGDALILAQANAGKKALGKHVQIIAKRASLYDTNI